MGEEVATTNQKGALAAQEKQELHTKQTKRSAV